MAEQNEAPKATISEQAIDTYVSAVDGKLRSDVFSKWTDGRVTRETHIHQKDGDTDMGLPEVLGDEQLKTYEFDWANHKVNLVKKIG
ncbi:MAG TPA: hypothetical protein VI819_03375 [Patescibacteria group bacterium]|nr:hypothetical protein [Patescibacteria group bacterium]